jgi:lipoyl(octanoyl) transferase
VDAPTSLLIRPTSGSSAPGPQLTVRWLGRIGYREAWSLQHRLAGARATDRIGDQLLLLEHDTVLTLGQYADESHVLASTAELASRGIEVIRVERGGEVTYHGPGQLVAYPILGLSRRGLMLRPLVRALEGAMIDTCAAFGVRADRRDGHPGCWCEPGDPNPRKIGALGIRVARGVTFHGIALNVSVDLADFDLIDPCGMPGVESTSIARELARYREPAASVGAPAASSGALPRGLSGTAGVRRAAAAFASALGARLDPDLDGGGQSLPASSLDDPLRVRRELEALLRDAEGSLIEHQREA